MCRLFSCPIVLCGAPPTVDNAFLIGRKRSHYDIHSVVRYQCADGFLQRHVPTAKCRANGKWDRPKIICIKCEFYTTGFSPPGWQTTILKAIFPFVRSFSHLHFLIFSTHTSIGQTSYMNCPQDLLSPCTFRLAIPALIINNCKQKDYSGCRLN